MNTFSPAVVSLNDIEPSGFVMVLRVIAVLAVLLNAAGTLYDRFFAHHPPLDEKYLTRRESGEHFGSLNARIAAMADYNAGERRQMRHKLDEFFAKNAELQTQLASIHATLSHISSQIELDSHKLDRHIETHHSK